MARRLLLLLPVAACIAFLLLFRRDSTPAEEPPVDFPPKPTGAIFGEVTLAGAPLANAGVELCAIGIRGDAELIDETSAWEGSFHFYLDPPKDVPLRLDVKSAEGILRRPLSFQWHGERMNLGRIDLVPYPSLRIRMRLPDGAYAPEVLTTRREDLIVRGGEWCVPAQCLGTGSHVAIPREEDVTMRLVFASDRVSEENFMVEREVALAFGRPRELDLVVRSGPILVSSRLVDERGRPVHARLALGHKEVATGEDGSFQIAVPCGGLHTVRLAAFDAPGSGWIELDRDAPEHRLLLDADDPAECRLDLGGRILVVAVPPATVDLFGVSGVFSPDGPDGATVGRLSWRKPAGEYTWIRGTWFDAGEDELRQDPGSVSSGVVTVEEGTLAVVDAR